ncbi:carbohydrate ABC transporter permease [Bacillus sp. FSL K6-3431]|uniref:carbohydrate ABC transporter permease n=1 Tax=Bacillus sp. FSL K6-3431 TaxID=2921500 RepID=UPI0030F86E1F
MSGVSITLGITDVRRRSILRTVLPYLYILPAFIPLFIFVFYPLINSVYISFLDWNMVSSNPKWVGASNYMELIKSSEFWTSVWNTVKYAAWLLLFLAVAPFFAAFGVTRVGKKAQQFYKTALFIPTVLSLAVASLIFLWLYNPVIGVFNAMLEVVHLPRVNWLTSPTWSLLSVSLIIAWKIFGYHFIIMYSALLSVPADILESLRVDGLKSKTKLIRKFLLPLTGGTVLYIVVMTIVNGIQSAFIPIQMLTNGGPDQQTNNLVFLTYQYAFQFFRSGLASAAGILTFLFFLIVIAIQAFVIDRKIHYES